MSPRRYIDLRAWQRADLFETAVLKLCEQAPLSHDFRLRAQLEDAAQGPPAHIAEGFGRFNPADFARFAVMARASLMESQKHLRTAMKKRHISETVHNEHCELAEAAIREVTGLITYLQSAEALTKAQSIRERAALRQQRRRSKMREPEPEPER